jgi:hypothetical protein
VARVDSTNVNAPWEMSQEQDKGKGQHPNTLSLWKCDVWEVCKDGRRNPQDSQVHSTFGNKEFWSVSTLEQTLKDLVYPNHALFKSLKRPWKVKYFNSRFHWRKNSFNEKYDQEPN